MRCLYLGMHATQMPGLTVASQLSWQLVECALPELLLTFMCRRPPDAAQPSHAGVQNTSFAKRSSSTLSSMPQQAAPLKAENGNEQAA